MIQSLTTDSKSAPGIDLSIWVENRSPPVFSKNRENYKIQFSKFVEKNQKPLGFIKKPFVFPVYRSVLTVFHSKFKSTFEFIFN
jgi:hypothetical protein